MARCVGEKAILLFFTTKFAAVFGSGIKAAWQFDGIFSSSKGPIALLCSHSLVPQVLVGVYLCHARLQQYHHISSLLSFLLSALQWKAEVVYVIDIFR